MRVSGKEIQEKEVMQTIISSGMLLAVLAMIAGISEGAVLSRCKLHRHMQEVFDRLPEEVLHQIDKEDLMAKSE